MKKFLMTSVLLTGLMSAPAMAQDMSREQIEEIVKEYIQNNPEIILDSVEAYGRAQQVADAQAQQEAIKEHMSWLENNDMLPVAGNENGDVTVVEFFDYNCGYCKKAAEDVMTLMGEDNQVKFIFVEMPILGPSSDLAARWAMAAKEQDAYLEYHLAIMNNRGPINEQTLTALAKNIGLDVEQMKKDAASEETAKVVAEKTAKAAQMGISGTPAFIIDGQLYGGYIGLDMMREAVKEARAAKEDMTETDGEG
jgi:protein-disulfide isomerase